MPPATGAAACLHCHAFVYLMPLMVMLLLLLLLLPDTTASSAITCRQAPLTSHLPSLPTSAPPHP
jgi:hypothetical protein